MSPQSWRVPPVETTGEPSILLTSHQGLHGMESTEIKPFGVTVTSVDLNTVTMSTTLKQMLRSGDQTGELSAMFRSPQYG